MRRIRGAVGAGRADGAVRLLRVPPAAGDSPPMAAFAIRSVVPAPSRASRTMSAWPL